MPIRVLPFIVFLALIALSCAAGLGHVIFLKTRKETHG